MATEVDVLNPQAKAIHQPETRAVEQGGHEPERRVEGVEQSRDVVLRQDDGKFWEAAIAERRALSPYKDRQIFVKTELSQQEVVISIRDEGPGFNPDALPDPTHPDHIGCACGRGVFLVRNFMDEVHYNEKGNEVTLVKRTH